MQPPHNIDTMTDEDAIALLSRIPSLESMGYVVRYGCGPPVWRVAPNIVAKRLRSPSELFMMNLASSQTSIAIPKILKCVTFRNCQYLLMEYVDGSDLHELWPTLSLWRRIRITWVLRSYVRQLRAVELPNDDIPGPFDASGAPLVCEGHHFTRGGSGPFASYAAMTKWYNNRSRIAYLLYNPSVTELSLIPPQVAFDDSFPLVFNHGDISTTNVRIGTDGTVWLLDWERAGAYPLWFEYANMMAYGSKVDYGERYDALIWPRGWKWFVPFITGRYSKQLWFMERNGNGIEYYGSEEFD
ncbi:hypothetical protein H0H92_012794 [Tricholoma furcatifolium]|nr:hypothetical protein H0H92_012794 [Tricholoma furcatifolium]